MSKEQPSVTELLLSLDSPDLEEAESVRAAINLQLSTDRGGVVLSSLVDYYLDYSSPQAVLLLSSTRESHHKSLLEKLNEALSKPGSRLPALTLLGHLVRNQPPWIHQMSRSPLLPSLLRCLKTDTDVVVLITGVLVLITLLPMIPQAGKPHIYDFFDVFGRLASWSLKNPGHVPGVQLVHLHAGVYSLFHRLYGMFPCNFMSYLRLHYSMKENLDTFQEIVKPMLEHVRVHPELVTGTQDYELDPSRWRCYEVHDILIECSRLSLDPLESSCEEDLYSSPRPPPLSSTSLSNLNLTFTPQSSQTPGDSGLVFPSLSGCQLSFSPTLIQADDVTWSPSSRCGLTTPPPEPAAQGSAHLLTRTASVSGKCPSSPSVPVTPSPAIEREGSSFQPIREQDAAGLSDVISAGIQPGEAPPPHSSRPLASTPSHQTPGSAFDWTPYKDGEQAGLKPSTPIHLTVGSASDWSSHKGEEPSYNQLFDLALPHASALFIRRKNMEALQRSGESLETGGGTPEEDRGEEEAISPLKALDQLIVLGHDTHLDLSKRLSASWKSVDRISGGCVEDLQSVRSQLFLVHTQLQFERFKRQQHAVRNRRLLRRVVNATALEEQSVAMRAQLASQDQEMLCLRLSLQEEQRRYTELQQDSKILKDTLQENIRTLLQQQDEDQREGQRLQSELEECQSRLREVEAELQRANNKVSNSKHQLTQLSLKVSSSEQLQQQIVLLNQQMILLRESNRALNQQLEAGHTNCCTEASMLQCTVGKEFQRLKDSEVQNRQKLEAANQRTAELENQLNKKEQLIQEQKKLLEDTKARSRAELQASDSCCVALRRLVEKLQVEMLHLYSQTQQQDSSRLNGGSDSSPLSQRSHPSSAAVAVSNGGLELLSSSSPIDSPLTVGSFLEQHARQMFGPTSQSLDEAEHQEEEEKSEEFLQPESPPLGQEAEEEEDEEEAAAAAGLIAGSPQVEPPSWPALPNASTDLTLAVRQRRHELSIMDYDELLPEI